MKKHDEGYVLVYVTVVLLVFCLVATVILTGALRSFNAQQNTIAQMKEQYIAEGEIEKVLAALDRFQKTGGVQTFECGETIEVDWDNSIDEETNKPVNVLTIQAVSGSVQVTCELKLTVTNVVIVPSHEGSATQLRIDGLTAYQIQSFRAGAYESVPAESVPNESGGGN